MTEASGTLVLPELESACLRSFSLFTRTDRIEVDFSTAPVFCLVGANGLGKSTFLAALSYALTGAVAQPGRKFRGVRQYYKQARSYAPKYFRGRIKPRDEESAEISLTFRAGTRRYSLTRAMFNAVGLRELTITDLDDGESILDTSDLDDEERNALYQANLTKDIGLDEFDQFVFLQLFILSFDERRELLFFDQEQKLLQQALYITFDLDPARAKEADKLDRRIEGLESLARNAKWQATNARNQLEALVSAGEEAFAEIDEGANEQRRLQADRDEALEGQERVERALADARLALAEQTASLQALRGEYDSVWSDRLQGNGDPAAHPLILATIEDARCGLCGTETAEVVARIESALAEHHCPLCATAVSDAAAKPDETMARLGELDAGISEVQDRIVEFGPSLQKLEEELTSSRAHVDFASKSLADFEAKNPLALFEGDPTIGLKAIADRFKAQIAAFEKEKEEKRAERDEVRKKLKPLQERLVRSFKTAEEQFIPSFSELAREFLGLDIEIDIEQKNDTVGLELRVEGSPRRATDTLSESQRFFIDIALRMALIQQMSDSSSPGWLFVDTPEGSLDIAYESRAGEMFNLFVERGHQLVMTANINSSQLLQRLAVRCGEEGLALERMTDWTDLSAVQSSEEDAFQMAWGEITASRRSKEAKAKERPKRSPSKR